MKNSVTRNWSIVFIPPHFFSLFLEFFFCLEKEVFKKNKRLTKQKKGRGGGDEGQITIVTAICSRDNPKRKRHVNFTFYF